MTTMPKITKAIDQTQDRMISIYQRQFLWAAILAAINRLTANEAGDLVGIPMG
jgi:hypothetical protein